MTRSTAFELVMLSVWLGATLLVAAVVAPAAFRVLPTRTLAGALVGQVLPVIFVAGVLVAAVTLAVELRAPMGSRGFIVLGPLVMMILACLIAQFVIGPRIEAVRAAIAGAVESLDVTDPRRVQFGRLHAVSVLLMGVAMVGAASVVFTKFFNTRS